MKRILLLLPVALLGAGCASVPPAGDATAAPAERVIPQGAPPENYGWSSDRSVIEVDLLASARDRFGEALLRRALAAPTYIVAKFYHGMLPPPRPGDPPYRPPVAVLFRENGAWLAATPDGARPANANTMEAIERILASPAFWSAPERGTPTCTDAGASLLLLKVPQRAETIRNGTCGPTEPTEQLVLRAIEG